MNFGFIIDNRKCIGCHACTVACKAEHEVPIGVNRTWVKYIEKGSFPDTRRLFSVMRCNHCADAPCVEICPVESLFTRKDGIVDFDDRRCIGCKACTQACPYDAIYMHPDEHTSAKCNYCSHRVDIGLEPACVNVCPEHAIISGDMDNPLTEISQLLAREAVSVRKAEKGTNPKLFYIDGDKASLDPTEANPNTDYMWSSQSSGVGHYAKFAEAKKSALVQIEGRASRQRTGPQASLPATVAASAAVKTNSHSADSTPQSPRRVYDAPNKGVLWGWEVSAYIWTKAIAAGAFLIAIFASFFMQVPNTVKWIGAITAMIFLAATGILLIMDLGRPERFLYVLLRPQWRSWLTRGAYIITVYGGLLTAWIVASYFGSGTALRVIEPLAIVFALLSAVYTAFLFAQAKGRDFWQSPMLGLHMIIHSLMAGVAVYLIALPWIKVDIEFVMAITLATFILLIIHLITLAIEMTTTHSTDDAHAVVKMITNGQFSRAFWLGMILVGNVLPMFLLLTGSVFGFALAGVLILVGMYIGERIWVKAPQLIPLS
ncbi:MAG: 4Fe-4S ferredoxin [Acidobacteria bacterium]|nr:MAG: 4Fe-4S ferredoxin [Acidobacteriota bacterium]